MTGESAAPAEMPGETLDELIDRARVAMAVYGNDGDFYGSEIISDLIQALAEKGEHIAMLQAMVSDSLYSKRQALEARALAAEKQLKPLLRVAKIANWMVKDLDAEKVAEHARNFPGTTGPRVGQSAARTRDLMAALKEAAAIRVEGE